MPTKSEILKNMGESENLNSSWSTVTRCSDIVLCGEQSDVNGRTPLRVFPRPSYDRSDRLRS